MFAQKNCAAITRLWARVIFAIAIVTGISGAATRVRASDTDSEHLFGFTEGADIGKAGECESESETIGRFGKAGGSYAALTQNDQVKWVPVENFRVGANTALAYFDIFSVPGLPDSQLSTLQGVSLEARAMLLDRRRDPFSLTLIFEPRWGRVDPTSGASATSYGGTMTVAADRELIDNRLFGAFNLLYDLEATRSALLNTWPSASKIGASMALSARLTSALFLGGEIRYLRAYDGASLGSSSGDAVFAGPTLYLQISKQVAMSAAWNMQIAGGTASGGALDLTHFERQQVKFRVNFGF
jgi:hypothetical protein